MYYFTAYIYKDKHGYWTFNIAIGAEDLTEASKIFYAWSCGILVYAEAVYIQNVSRVAGGGVTYYLPNDPTLREHIKMYLNGEHKELSIAQEKKRDS